MLAFKSLWAIIYLQTARWKQRETPKTKITNICKIKNEHFNNEFIKCDGPS